MYDIINVYTLNSIFSEVFMMSKTFWRAVWLAAVALGGVSLVKISLEVLNLQHKKYIDV